MQLVKIIVVNNGKQPIKEQYGHIKGITVINAKENLGWEGGLKLGLSQSDSKFVCFMNDDVFLPKVSQKFFEALLMPFQDKNVAAVGPATTTAAGIQSIFNAHSPMRPAIVNWLIFFTVLIRREYLDAVGGIDTELPGGDDIDLSMRLRKAGFKLYYQPDAFIIHYGFKTGNRVYGDGYAGVKNGWNSPEMTERTNQALIQKHGFKTFFETISCQITEYHNPWGEDDPEGKIIASMIQPTEKTLELGCGFRKTVPHAFALDRIPGGEPIPLLLGPPTMSVADKVADITQELPVDKNSYDVVIARHILEHCVDIVTTIKHWIEPLKVGGRLIIAVPDQEVLNGIPLSPDHVHAFDGNALKSILELIGLKHLATISAQNGVSFIASFEKLPVKVDINVNGNLVNQEAAC